MLLIGNGRLWTMDSQQRWFDDGAVVCSGDKIIGVGETARLLEAYPDAEYLDAAGGLIMPALINTHQHSYSALARGISLPGYQPSSFLDILNGLWWKLDRCLNLEDIRISARLTALESVKNGVTTIFDHHAGYGAISGSLETIANEFLAAGLRSCCCFEISDRDGAEKAAAAIAENSAFARWVEQQSGDNIAACCGLHASFTLSDATLEQAKAAMPEDLGFHIHVAEGPEDLAHCQGHYQQRVVERLQQRGILGPRSLAVHCVHIDRQEIEILAETATPALFNPQSNMSNGVGCPPIAEMVREGVTVGLGSDGYTNDMLESLKCAALLLKHEQRDAQAGAEAPELLFRNNRAIAARFFRNAPGQLQAGAPADIIVCAYQPPTPLEAANAVSHLLMGVSGRDVLHTVAQGLVLMENRQVLYMDEQQIMAEAREQAASLWQRINYGG